MKLKVLLFLLSSVILISSSFTAIALDPTTLPLLKDMSNRFKYKGAFKMYGGVVGDSKLNNSEAIFDVNIDYQNPENNSFFITSHTFTVSCFIDDNSSHKHSIAELPMPDLVNSTNLDDLNTVSSNEFNQPFTNILDYDRISDISIDYSNPSKPDSDCLDSITGIKYLNGSLILNAMEYYDGNNNNVDSALLIEDASNLATSKIEGFFKVEGAAHTARWISDVPAIWQPILGGDYIFGNGNNYPRNDRQSMGPSAFIVDSSKFISNPTSFNISSVKLLDYTLETIDEYYGYGGAGQYIGALHPDFFNIKGNNKLWTEKSKAVYGFIVPGTRTYAVIGSSGGHNSRICYKNTYTHTLEDFNNGKRSVMDEGCATVRTQNEIDALPPSEQQGIQSCGGYCIVDPDDHTNYYWLYDVNDLIKVKNGELKPGEVLPYKTGVYNVPFQENIKGIPEFHAVASASFDPKTLTLYVSIEKAGEGSSNSNRAPVMIAYELDTKQPKPPSGISVSFDHK